MTNSKEKKKYILTIVHIAGEDSCEYIKEEIIEDSDEPSWIYGEIDLKDYFSDSDIACLTCSTIGKS